jgi:phospholipid/cholesterol/gamma-HCH transport system permease protein
LNTTAILAAASPTQRQAPRAEWAGSGEDWVLALAGDWRGSTVSVVAPPQELSALQHGRVRMDGAGIVSWDAGLASTLWRQLTGLRRGGLELDLQGLPAGLREIVTLALPKVAAGADTAAAPPSQVRQAQQVRNDPQNPLDTQGRPAQPAPGLLARLGARGKARLETGGTTLAFVGNVALSLGRLLRGRSDMRFSDFAWQLDQTGPRSLPIVALVSFLVGLIVAYMGAAQLERFGAQTYIADLVTVGVVREIAALLVGIVLSGRVGAAFAAQIGSMRANEEVDALQTMGIDPVDNLVLPRVLALLVVGPVLTVFAALVGMAVGWLVAVLIYDVTPLEYLYKSVEALTLPHVLIGLLKGTVYAVLVALAGCLQGLSAGRSAQAVGDATTAAVVQAIVWIVVAASTLTVIFQRLDW